MSAPARAWDREHWLGRDGSTQTLALSRLEHRRLADVLLMAAEHRRAIAPLSERYPELTVGDAARIRDTAIVSRIAQGERLIGAKVSLGERRPATDEPRLGWLTDGMLLTGPQLDPSDLIHPRVEAKVAFLLGRPLRGRVRTVGDLLALTECVLPCLDIVDVRYQEAGVDRVDEIADNCAAARLLVGTGIPAPAEEQLLRIRAHLDVEPSPAARTRDRANERVSPVAATLWLANRVIEEGGELEPGSLLVAPACCGPVELRPGTRVTAEFSGLGRLELETTGEEPNR